MLSFIYNKCLFIHSDSLQEDLGFDSQQRSVQQLGLMSRYSLLPENRRHRAERTSIQRRSKFTVQSLEGRLQGQLQQVGLILLSREGMCIDTQHFAS